MLFLKISKRQHLVQKDGQLEYLVMPMGLCYARAKFQLLMNRVVYDCMYVFIFVYLDDLLRFSEDEESHFEHLDIVILCLKEHKVYISPKKCDFMKDQIDVLGLTVGKSGIHVDPKRVKILQTWSQSK